MKEADLRRVHRLLALPVALLAGMQGVTGLYLTLEDLGVIPLILSVRQATGLIHYGWSLPGGLYRLAAGLGVLLMAVTGVMIWGSVRARLARTARTARPAP